MSDLKEEAPDVMIEGFGDLVDHNSYAKYTARYPHYEELLRAFLDGYHSRDSEIAHLEARCDNLYLAAFTPKEKRELINRRLDEHFAREAEAFFAEVSQ